jgi:hypothetical protein
MADADGDMTIAIAPVAGRSSRAWSLVAGGCVVDRRVAGVRDNRVETMTTTVTSRDTCDTRDANGRM